MHWCCQVRTAFAELPHDAQVAYQARSDVTHKQARVNRRRRRIERQAAMRVESHMLDRALEDVPGAVEAFSFSNGATPVDQNRCGSMLQPQIICQWCLRMVRSGLSGYQPRVSYPPTHKAT